MPATRAAPKTAPKTARKTAPQRAPRAAAKPAPPLKGKTIASAPTKPVEPKPTKVKAEKLVRDSFTLPKADHQALVALKQRSITLAQPAKKSEIVRAGIHVLTALSDRELLAALARVPALKTGRPKG